VALAATVAAPLWGPAIAGPLRVPAAPDAGPGVLAETGLDATALPADAAEDGTRGGVVTRLAAALEGARAEIAAAGTPLMRWAALPRGWMPWVAVSATGLAALLLVGGLVHLRRRTLGWDSASWRERTVWIAPDFGPAVVGLARPRPVLPRWVLELDEDEVELIVRHEEAHARAGDPALLLAAVALAVVAPWNPAVWVQLRRLRDAVEVDCDARVLRGGVSPSRYGRLLVAMRARGHTGALPSPALLDSPESLERRLTNMFMKRTTLAGALPALIGAGLLVLAACETPAPTGPAQLEPENAGTLTAEQVPSDEEGFTVIEVKATPTYPDPLIIVDGEPIEGALGQLEAMEIRSIEVVKGEAARASYGAEGAGGVIRIVTVEGEARELGVPVEELRQRIEVERAARGRVVAGRPTPQEKAFTKPADEPTPVEVIEVLPDPSFDASETKAGGVVKVRPATGTVRAEPAGEVSSLEAVERSAAYVERTGALILVDGIVKDSLSEVDPATVESIQVMKGAAARELFGSRAGNGVVVVRTVRGGGD
jgi:TonB-dependent SusC/RagA subfamily outer membrane receptor